MKYIGAFNSIDNRQFRVEMDSGGSGQTQIKFNGTPFVSSVSSSEKHIYSPIRCGGATVGLLTDSYIFNLYSGEAKGVSVKLIEQTESGDRIRWTGYVEPTIYDQGYDEHLEELNIDCVDGIAVLKNIPYRGFGDGESLLTFEQVIFACLKQSGCYQTLYVSDNVQLNEGGIDNVLRKFRISPNNFMDERKDVEQTEDDLAWSCYDVLNEILQWLGYTLVVDGDAVVIMDYDAVKEGQNYYFKYSLLPDQPEAAPRGELVYSKAIKGADYAGTGSKLSLEPIYNKATVKDQFKTYDDLFPQFGDDLYETNVTADSDSQTSLMFHVPARPEDNFSGNTYVYFVHADDWTDRSSNPTEKEHIQVNIIRFYDSSFWDFRKYNTSGVDVSSNGDLWGKGKFKFNNMEGHNGGFYYRIFHSLITRKVYEEKWIQNLKSKDTYDALCLLLGVSGLNQISMKPMIMFRNPGETRIGPADGVHYNDLTDNDITKNYPFLSIKGEKSASIFGGKNHILRIKGKLRFHNRWLPVPLDFDATPYYRKYWNDYSNSRKKCADDKKHGDQGYIWCKVKWGNAWWDGSSWQKSQTWFKLYFWDKLTSPTTIKMKEIFNKDFDFCSNPDVPFMGTDGYVIPCPPDENLQGTAEVSFATRDIRGAARRNNWHPKGTKLDNFYCRTYSEYVFLSDLSITAEVSPGILSDGELDSDTFYTNVIENGSISAMDEITFKVCTDDGKKPSYSCVDYLDGSQSKFVTTTYNKALRQKEKGTVGTDGLDACLRQEEHLVFKLATHYEDPKLVFKCEIHNEDHRMFGTFTDVSFPGHVFFMTERQTDWRFNSDSITLTEL